MGFLVDLKQWEEFERFIINKFKENFWLEFRKNENVKWVDLVHPLMSMEIKFDRQFKRTGNVFIEIMNNRVPSWLFARFDIHPYLFLIGNEEESAVFHTDELKELILNYAEDGTFKLINAGDGKRSRWMLVDWDTLKEEAIFLF